MSSLDWWRSGDAVTQSAALLLLLMSVASWVVIFWKLRMLQRAAPDLARSQAAFWQAPNWQAAAPAVAVFDRDALLSPLVAAALEARAPGAAPAHGSAEAIGIFLAPIPGSLSTHAESGDDHLLLIDDIVLLDSREQCVHCTFVGRCAPSAAE